MIELFKLIEGNNCINGINTSNLIALFVNDDNSVYDIAMIGKGKVVLKNKEDNKFEKLDCICNYFDIQSTDCNDIKTELNFECSTCKECFKCALKQLETGEMSLK